MKSCPSCRKTYSDNTLNFCLNDGTALVTTMDDSSPETVPFSRPVTAEPTARFTRAQPAGGGYAPATVAQNSGGSKLWLWILLAVAGVMIFLVAAGAFAFYQYSKGRDVYVANTDNSNTSRSPSTTDTSSGISKDKYERIKNGMTRSEVNKILGGAGDEITSMDMGSIGKFSAYRWNGENESYITVNFTDDKVAGKSQFGLEGQTTDVKNKSDITLEKFEQIKNGMNRSEVEEILGPGSEISNSKSAGKTYTMYQWSGDKFANVMVNFTDDKVTGKSQFGLGDPKNANLDLSKANYEKIKTGMKLDEVQQILGGPGDAISNTGSGAFSSSVYKWSGSNYSFIVVGFMNGKVITKSQNGLK